MPRRPLLLETLEDRILCDAAAPVDPALVEKTAAATADIAVVADTAPQAPASPAPATDAAPATTATTAPAAAGELTQLTDAQRAALESVVKDSTNQIWFETNVGQFADGVLYGFKTQFGGMLVYEDHISVLSDQADPVTGEVGIHTVNISFNGSTPWQIVPGGDAGVLGTYQQADGTALTPEIFQEITLRNVYNGVDLRLYSADQGVLEFDWLVAKAQDYEKIRIDFTGQDGLVFNADGSATLDLRYQDLTLKIPEVYQLIDGQKQLLGATMVAGENPGEMRYSLTGNIVADQALVIDPNVAWSTYFDLNDTSSANAFDSYLLAVQVNSTGVYAAGWVKETITNGSYGNYMQVNAGFAQGTAINQNYIYRLNTTGTAITAWTGTGIVGSSDGSASTNPATDLELFPDGRVLVSYRDSTIQIFSADLATRTYSAKPVAISTVNSLAIVNDSTFYAGGLMTAANAALIPAASGLDDVFAGASEAVIIRYTLAGVTPVADWATYIGGNAGENFTAIALTPDLTKLVFAVHSDVGAAYSTLVNAVDSTVAGATEILTGVINEQAAKPAAFNVFSFLGGSGAEGTTGSNSASVVIAAKNTGYWVAGNTASVDLPGTAGGAQTTFGGGTNDSFLSYIPINGSAGTGFRSSYNGGAGSEITGGIGYDAFRDRVFVFGTTSGSFPVADTTPTSIYFDNSFGGGAFDIFISTFTGNVATRDYATYIGGAGNDYLGDTGRLLGTGHVTYSAATDQVYLATTVHSSLPANVVGAGIPGYDLTKSNVGNDVHVIFAFNINIFDHGDAPASYEGSPSAPAAEAISQFIRLGATVDAEYTSFSGAAATGDDIANNGSANDEDGITAALPVLLTTDASYTVNVSVLNNTGAAQILQGWIDLNGDGVFGANERATVSVVASALQQSVSLVWSTLPGITSGSRYLRLRFTDTIPADVGATTIDERSVGTDLSGHGEVEDYALTIFPAASNLSGAVYRDLNNDGLIAGVGETGIAGVTVTLTGTNDLGAAVNQAAITDASGNYSFLGIRPSDATGYTLTETQPGAFLDGKNTAGTSGGTTVNNPASDFISGIVLAGNTTATGYNFGELPPTSLAGTVYRDLNNDGVQLGAGETGVNAVTVTLTGTDDLGAAVSTTTTTNAAGAYSFGNLRPGTYTLTETQPAGLFDGKETAGTGVITPGTVNNAAVSNTISGIVVGAGQTGAGNNFGDLPPSSLAGVIYRDINNDGVQLGAGETAVAGVAVALTGTDDFGAAVSLASATDAAGAYSFANLRPGTYTITETQPAALLDGRETVGTQTSGTINNAADSNTISSIALAANVTGAGNNFGELPPSTLSGSAYIDANNDGTFQGGETAQSGVTVTLTGTDDRGTAVNVSTTTDGAGAYAFTTLRPGTYTLTETPPAGLLDGRETVGAQASGTVDNATDSDTISGILLAANVTGTANNFADLRPAALAGAVFSDANNDGLVNGADTGISGATVTLTGTDDRGIAVNVSAPTNGSGVYSFGTLRPGTYTLTETQPAGFLDGADTIGTPGGAVANDVFSGIALTEGTNGADNNFAELAPASLAGSVYLDANNDGVRQGGETGLAGVTVTLTGNNDLGAVNVTTTTDAGGAYTFANLRPSDATGYTMTETQAAGYGDGTDAIGTQGGNLGNDVLSGIVLGAGVGGTGNNFGERIEADLAITKTDGSATYTPGAAISYTVVVSNGGPSFVSGAVVADTIPANISGAAWTAVYAGVGSAGAASGSGDINTAIDLASGGSATFTITGTVLVTATGNLVNTATVAAPAGATDPTPGNNSATDTDTASPVADLAITKTDGSATYTAGTAISYTVVVSNGGPSFVTGAVVADTVPANISGATWTAVYAGVGSAGAASGSGDINEAINLASGGSATFTITGTVLASATGNLVNTATVAAPAGVTDPTPGNNSATDTDTPNPVADLAITKTDGVASVVPGTATTYTIVVSNTGPSFVTGATVADTLPATLTGVSWTAVYAGVGSAGAAGGVGNISTTIDLAVGGTATFTVTGTVAETATGTLVNTATVTPPVGTTDPTPGNNSATDTDTLTPVADLSITKTDGSATYIPGTAISYTVVVSNSGPSFVSGATVADTIPANIGGAAWMAVYAGAGSAGAASGSGDINEAINLASGGSATFTITGTVLASATGNLVNTATVAAPAGVTDPTPGNNSATDTDTANPVADLAITKTDGVASVVPGTATTYTIVVSNTGPSFVTGATVADTLPATLTGVSWTAVYTGVGSAGAAGGAGNISTTIDLAVGGSATFTVTGTVASTATGSLVNTATVTPPVGTTDPTPGNNSATDTDTLTPVADLSVTKTDGSATYISGTAISYTVVVSNTGPSFVTGAVVADTIPANISGATWTAVYAGAGSGGAAGGIGDISTTIDLASGGSATFTITGTVLLTATGDLVNTATVTPPAGVTDPTPGNDSATDTDARDLTSLAGFVFNDANNDGIAQVGESGIAGATVTLTGTDNLGGAVNVTVTTLADGSYSFVNLRPSNAAGYAITETQPAGFLDGTDTLGTPGGVAGNDVFSTIILAQGVIGADNNFGELAPSSLSGSVYNDTNNDGTAQVGESGIAGVTVTLTGTDDLGVIAPIVATTLADGSYTFGNLRPGTYAITETQPAGFLDGKNTAGTAGGTTVNNPLSDVITAIMLPSNTAVTGYLFGELAPATFSGTVFHDLNNDGVNDPADLQIPGATVTLTGTDDLGAAVNTGATTAADGTYTFANLRPGTYTLTETQPAGYLDGTDTAGTAGGTPANDSFSAIALAVGQTGGGYLFGERTAPDLVVTKSDGIAIAHPGELLTYTITVANASLQQADSVTVTDQFPSSLEFISADNGGVLNPVTGVITWSVGAIAGSNAQTVTLTVIARVPATLPASLRSVTNTVTALDVSGVDADPANNTTGDTDSIPAPADLYVLKTDNLATAQVGQQTTYTITGGNAGGQTAQGVVITDTLPAGLRFVSASNGGQLTGGQVVWNLGDLPPGATFSLTVRVVVESAASGKNVINTVTIADRFGSFEDATPLNNSATDPTRIAVANVFAFDSFHDFASRDQRPGLLPHLGSIDVSRDALLPLAPIYSGEADPGSTLVIALYNAKGEHIGSQTVVVDAGGNWLASFPSTTVRDVPQSVQITQLTAPYSLGDSFGHNLRTYFSPALNPGHFFLQTTGTGLGNEAAPLLNGLGLENPLQLGTVKYGGELLSTQATASGY